MSLKRTKIHFMAKWLATDGRWHSEQFYTYPEMISYIKKECEFFQDRVKQFEWSNEHWVPVTKLKAGLYNRNEILAIYMNLIY